MLLCLRYTRICITEFRLPMAELRQLKRRLEAVGVLPPGDHFAMEKDVHAVYTCIINKHTHTHIHTRRDTHTYICIYIYTVYIYIYICIYT